MGEITFLSEETTTCDMLFHFEGDIRQMLICLQNLQDLSGSQNWGPYTDDLIVAWLSADFRNALRQICNAQSAKFMSTSGQSSSSDDLCSAVAIPSLWVFTRAGSCNDVFSSRPGKPHDQ